MRDHKLGTDDTRELIEFAECGRPAVGWANAFLGEPDSHAIRARWLSALLFAATMTSTDNRAMRRIYSEHADALN